MRRSGEDVFGGAGLSGIEVQYVEELFDGANRVGVGGHEFLPATADAAGVASLEGVPRQLLLADAETAKDVLTFLGRATRISDEGVRLQAARGVLALTGAALAPHGLFDQTPTVLAMRVVQVDPELECDVVVSSLTATDDDSALTLPETGLSPAWAGVAPPVSYTHLTLPTNREV